MKDVTTRFAPSPTGRLHLGHLYSALLAHDFARSHGGFMLLRIEDIDPGRVRTEYVDAIVEDLKWLGLDWQGEILFQSRRPDFYAENLARLKEMGLLYPCFCTRSEIAAEIEASASAPHGPDGPPYPGICRGLSLEQSRRRLATEPHAWRLDTAEAVAQSGPLYWHDGDTEVLAEPEAFGDVVLARKDAPASYHLAVTVDDAAQGVTDVVRGRDLYAATDIHRLLQALLGLPTPAYHHHPLLCGPDGRRLAKRHGAPTVAALRAAGVEPRKLAADLLAGRLPAGYSAAGA